MYQPGQRRLFPPVPLSLLGAAQGAQPAEVLAAGAYIEPFEFQAFVLRTG